MNIFGWAIIAYLATGIFWASYASGKQFEVIWNQYGVADQVENLPRSTAHLVAVSVILNGFGWPIGITVAILERK